MTMTLGGATTKSGDEIVIFRAITVIAMAVVGEGGILSRKAGVTVKKTEVAAGEARALRDQQGGVKGERLSQMVIATAEKREAVVVVSLMKARAAVEGATNEKTEEWKGAGKLWLRR